MNWGIASQYETIGLFFPLFFNEAKGQLISKANCQAKDFSKKQTNEFVFTSMVRVFVPFLEESSARKKRFENIWPLVSRWCKAYSFWGISGP